jgi:hypothetical protein
MFRPLQAIFRWNIYIKWPVGAETYSGVVIVINKKTFGKILLRLTAPPNIVIIDATVCNPQNKKKVYSDAV